MAQQKQLTKQIEYTALFDTISTKQIEEVCISSMNYAFGSICIAPCFVSLAKKLLKNSQTKISTIISYPFGLSSTESKVFEARDALKKGADTIEMVVNPSILKEERWNLLEEEIQKVKSIIDEKPLKVVLETSSLLAKEIREGCRIAENSGASSIKNSTGFNQRGATLESIQIMKRASSPLMKIEASTKVKTISEAQEFFDAGASLVGSCFALEMMR